MNFLFHFLFNYLVVAGVAGPAAAREGPLLLILVSSTIMDLDHLAYVFTHRRTVLRKRGGAGSHSELHEMLGLTIFSLFFVYAYLYMRMSAASVGMMALCLILHLAVDFVTGKTIPLRPFSRERTTFLNLSLKGKVAFEIVLTTIAGGLSLLLWLSL